MDVVSQEDIAACKAVKQRGVQLIATAHGQTIENVMSNDSLVELFGGIKNTCQSSNSGVQNLTGKEPAVDMLRERSGTPIFDMVVEMRTQDLWIVHDTTHSVDQLLCGENPGVEVKLSHAPRYRNSNMTLCQGHFWMQNTVTV